MFGLAAAAGSLVYARICRLLCLTVPTVARHEKHVLGPIWEGAFQSGLVGLTPSNAAQGDSCIVRQLAFVKSLIAGNFWCGIFDGSLAFLAKPCPKQPQQ